MLKRKSYTFWTVVIIAGLIPSVASAATQAANPGDMPPPPPGSLNNSALPMNFPAPPSVAPAASSSSSSQASSDASAQQSASAPKYLNSTDVNDTSSGITDLKISIVTLHDGSKYAELTGLYPPSCANKLQVVSTATSSDIQAKDGTSGFSIQDMGGLKACIADEKKAGIDCSNPDVACNSLSQKLLGSQDPKIKLDPNNTISVAYLNKTNSDSALGDNWSADASTLQKFLSTDAIKVQQAEAKIKADSDHQKALQDAIQSCASSADSSDDISAVSAALKTSGIDPSSAIYKQLQGQINDKEKSIADSDLKDLQAQVDSAVNNGDVVKFDDLEQQVYDYYKAHKATDKNGQLADKLANMVYQMATARTNANGATDEDIDKALASLKKAVDPETGFKMSAKNKQTFQVAIGAEIPAAHAAVAELACDQDKANLQSAYQQYQSNPYLVANVLNSTAKSAQADCTKAIKLEIADQNSILKAEQNGHCNATAGASAGSGINLPFGGSSNASSSASSSKGTSSTCEILGQETADIQSAISNTDSTVQQEVVQAQQQQQALARALSPTTGTGGQQQQYASQFSVNPNTNFLGSPPASFSNPYGYGGYSAGAPVTIPNTNTNSLNGLYYGYGQQGGTNGGVIIP